MDAETLKAIRSQLGISQEAMARLIGVALMTLNRWELDKQSPSKLAVRRIEAIMRRHHIVIKEDGELE